MYVRWAYLKVLPTLLIYPEWRALCELTVFTARRVLELFPVTTGRCLRCSVDNCKPTGAGKKHQLCAPSTPRLKQRARRWWQLPGVYIAPQTSQFVYTIGLPQRKHISLLIAPRLLTHITHCLASTIPAVLLVKSLHAWRAFWYCIERTNALSTVW